MTNRLGAHYSCEDLTGMTGTAFAETFCCVMPAAPVTFYCNTDFCSCDCTDVHEGVHRKQLASCCSLATLCRNNPANVGGVASSAQRCEGAYDDFRGENVYIWECAASTAEVNCLEDAIWGGCTGGEWDSCCAEWMANYVVAYNAESSMCAYAKGKKPTACPIDPITGKIS